MQSKQSTQDKPLEQHWFEANELKQIKPKLIGTKLKVLICSVTLMVFTCTTPAPVTPALPAIPAVTPQQLKQYQCVKEVLYYEARGESQQGIKAVLSVVHNRANADYSLNLQPDYCKVIHASKQFSYRNSTIALKPLKTAFSASEHQQATYISDLAYRAAMGGFKPSLPASVKHYCNVKINPSWSKKMKTYATIGHHKFFRG